jgi:hypothetical protein
MESDPHAELQSIIGREVPTARARITRVLLQAPLRNLDSESVLSGFHGNLTMDTRAEMIWK